jgi:hypothetical protein
MKRLVLAATVMLLLCMATGPALAQATAGGSEASPEALAPLVFMVPFALFWFIYMLMIPLLMLLGVASWVLSALAIYDCVLRDFEDRSGQALWCVLIFLTRWIGALIYYFAIYRPNSPPRAA